MLFLEDKDITYLKWLYNRLKYRYSSEDSLLQNLESIIKKISPPLSISIDEDSLDKILSKYYVDFYLEKEDSSNIGFNQEERIKLRSTILNLTKDIVNLTIPKELIIKDK